MKTVEHEGKRYLLVKQSGDASRVRDPVTGDEQYVSNETLTPLDEGPLETAAKAVSEPVRTLVRATTDERALGLLIELHSNGPLPIRALLTRYDLCESDALGVATEFRTAGLISETTVAGERGYELTERGETAVEAVLN